MERTNIFKYAKKELSQDAVICSILAEEDYRATAFLRALINSRPICSDRCIELPASFIIIPDSLKQQDGYIDIFLEILDPSTDKKFAVIIEDKTDTSLHDQQMTQYIAQKMKDGHYTGCYFILFKTGKIPFWEVDNYRDEIHSIQSGKLEQWQFVKTKLKTEIEKQVSFLRNQAQQLRFSLFDRDSFIRFLKMFDWDDYRWMDDYLLYITDEGWLRSDTVFPWMEQYTGTKSQFANALSGGLWKRISIYTPEALGKRNFDCAFEGICGVKAREFKPSSIIREAYYFLPVVSFTEKKAQVKLNFHAFQNENHPQGYESFSKYSDSEIKESYRKYRAKVYTEIKKLLENKGWTFKAIKDNSLKICSFDVDYMPDELITDFSIQRSNLCRRVCELLDAVMTVRKTLFDE